MGLTKNRLIPTIIRYRYLFVLLLLFFLFFAAVEIKAEGELDYVTPNMYEEGKARDEGRGGELSAQGYSSALLHTYTAAVVCDLGGVIGCTADETQVYKYFNNSVLGMTTQGVALAYAVPPAGVGPFIADAAMRAGFVDKAYAQGIGFTSLAPLIPVWRAFRNATYAVMILVLLIFGVLIMLRRQIDPQTVITIQNSLPRIVLTLILITFSYAIAGFVIDLMYVAILLIVGLFESVGLIDLSGIDNAAQKFTTGGMWQLALTTFGLIGPREALTGAAPPGGGVLARILGKILAKKVMFSGLGGFIGGPIGILLGIFVGSALGSLVPGAGFDLSPGGILKEAVTPLFWFFMLIVFLFAFLRLVFLLFSSYIQIIANIIFAPIQLVADVIPGGSGFYDWITNLIGHAIVFPVTIAMILVGHAITKNADTLWSPPLIMSSGSFIQSLIGLGIIMLIPNIAGSIREKFKAVAPGGVTGGAVAGGLMRPVTGLTSGISTFATFKTALKS